MSMSRSRLHSGKTTLHAAVAATLITLGACASNPPVSSALQGARSMYAQVQSNPSVNAHAALELKEAGDALARAERAWKDDERQGQVDHLAYLAYQRSAIAQETARTRAAEATIRSATAERDRVQLIARTNEARRAEMLAANAEQRADMARQQAEQAYDTANAKAAQAREAEARAAAAAQKTRDAQAHAMAANQQAREAEARAQLLASQLNELAAQKTERGMVITLGGDVLFDVDQAVLKPGAMRSLEKVADFMKRYPDRKLVVEGFTDSTGSEAHNDELSQRRATAVGEVIVAAGIDPERVITKGYGESFPVASNDNPAGRQMNRRVEVIISNDGADVAPRMDVSMTTAR